MVHQHRLVNWMTEDNSSSVDDARSRRYMLGVNSANNSSVGFSNLITRGSRTTSMITNHNHNRSSSPPRVTGSTLNIIPTLDNNNTSHVIDGRSTHVIDGQTGVGVGSINNNTTTMMNEVVVADEEPRSTTTIQSQDDDGLVSYHNSTHQNRPLDILSLLSHEEHPWMNFIRRRPTGEAIGSSSGSISSRQNDNNNNNFNFSDTFLVPPPPSNSSPSSETPASLGGNNNISISTSEIMADTNRLMNEIQSSLQYLRNGGTVRREDIEILDFLLVLNPLIDSEDWLSEIMADFESQMASVETGLTEEQILICINEETYQFNTDETSTQNQTCTICLEEFVEGERICRLDCMHMYHLDCIKPWLELRNACPICNEKALEIDEDGNESEDGN